MMVGHGVKHNELLPCNQKRIRQSAMIISVHILKLYIDWMSHDVGGVLNASIHSQIKINLIPPCDVCGC